MRNLDGKLVKLSELKEEVVFLNQWATWRLPGRNAGHDKGSFTSR